MTGVNKVILLGNLGQKPDTRYVNQNLSFSRLSVATTELYTNLKGEQTRYTEWHTVVLWRQLSRFAEQYLRQGDTVYIEGRIKSRFIELEGGERRKVTEIVADRCDLIAHHDTPKEDAQPENNEPETPGSGLPGLDLENLPQNIPAGDTLPF
ncbi:MAG: single-stranded DNA-binding protein [Bacteroidales bacterium]|nr:single-stranded DNA-binding protein [Bacteroidales bacterium]